MNFLDLGIGIAQLKHIDYRKGFARKMDSQAYSAVVGKEIETRKIWFCHIIEATSTQDMQFKAKLQQQPPKSRPIVLTFIFTSVLL